VCRNPGADVSWLAGIKVVFSRNFIVNPVSEKKGWLAPGGGGLACRCKSLEEERENSQ